MTLWRKGLQLSAFFSTGADEVTIKEFRKQMQQMVDEVGLNKLAREYGFSASSLSKWLSDPDPNAPPPKKVVKAMGKRLRITVVEDKKK